MALEDRCSPQSAPSPPGIPHSPQNTANNYNESNENSSPTGQLMSVDVITESEHSENEQPEPINFSISNILSSSFGKAPKKAATKKDILFRPYDNPSPVQTHARHSALLQDERVSHPYIHHQYNMPIDFSVRVSDHFLSHVDSSRYLHGYNPFHLASSHLPPKFQEEVLDNIKYQQYYQTTQALTAKSLSKMPPLGNLCKTVSQIGQSDASDQQKGNRILAATSPRVNDSTANVPEKVQPSNGLDSGMESSDDTKSETSSMKDDSGNQQWPAWIYCTRYSDRPSSGNFEFILSNPFFRIPFAVDIPFRDLPS